MRKFMFQFISAMLMAVVLTTTGCATWWSNFKADPVAQVQSVISALETVVTISTVIFSEVKPLIPEAKRDAVQTRFSAAILAVEAAKRMIRDALAVSEAAHQDPADLSAAITNAIKAADDLRTLIREFQNTVRMSAPANVIVQPPAKPDDLDAAVAAVQRFRR